MPNRFPFAPDEDESIEKAVYNPLFPSQMESGGGDEYQKLLMSQLNQIPSQPVNDDSDDAQLIASIGSAANALGSVGGRTADSSGLQNWADLMSKRSMQKQDKLEAANQKRQNILAQMAMLKDKQTFTAKEKQEDRLAKAEQAKTEFGQKKELAKLENAGRTLKEDKPKPPTADEKTSALFATRAKDASDLAQNIEKQGYDPASYGASFRSTALPFVGQVAATSDDRSYNQAKRSFISAVLRKESGAAISKEEFANEEKKYFPEPGDGPEQIAQKAAERSRAVQTLITASGGAYSPESQMPFDYKKPEARPDGLIAAPPPTNVPKVGDVVKGYRFKGGNPADKTSWEKANG